MKAQPSWQMDLYKLFGRMAAAYQDADTVQRGELERKLRPVLRRIKNRTPDAKHNTDTRTALLSDMDEAATILDLILGPDWQPSMGSLGAQLKGIGLI